MPVSAPLKDCVPLFPDNPPLSLSAENITIEGNDEPLISGLLHDITCTFTGGNVSLIEWLAVVGDLEFTATKDISGARVLLLSLTVRLSTDGSQFKCRVVDSSGRAYSKTIVISVKSKFAIRNIHVRTLCKGNLQEMLCVFVILLQECPLF